MNNQKFKFGIITFFLIIILSSSFVLGALVDDTTVYWKFEENAANTDVIDAHNSNDGTANTNTVNLHTEAGIIDDAFYLDGNEQIEVPDSNDLDISADFSISLWVNPDVADADNRFFHKYSDTDGGWCGYYLGQYTDGDGRVRFAIYVNGVGVKLISDAKLSTTKLSHVVVTRADSDGQMLMYIDGVKQSDETKTKTGDASGSGALFIGASTTNATRYAGVMDEIMFTNSVLSQDSVDDLYNSGSAWAYPFSAGGSPSANFTIEDVSFKKQLLYINGSISVDRIFVNDSFGYIQFYNLTGGGNFTNIDAVRSANVTFFGLNYATPNDNLEWSNGTIIYDISNLNITIPPNQYAEILPSYSRTIHQPVDTNIKTNRLSNFFKNVLDSFTLDNILEKIKGIERRINQVIKLLKIENFYNFSVGNSLAYNNSVEETPPGVFTPAGELKIVDTTNISLSDDKYITTSSSTEAPYHKFNMTITEASIDYVEFLWEGHTHAGGIISLYVWNYTFGNWSLIDSGSGITDFELSTTLYDLNNIRVGTGNVTFLVQTEA